MTINVSSWISLRVNLESAALPSYSITIFSFPSSHMRRKRENLKDFFMAIFGSGTYFFLQFPTGQNLVTWLNSGARDPKKSGPAVCLGSREEWDANPGSLCLMA